MFKKLLPFASKYWPYVILTPLFMVGEVLLEIRIPLLMANIVDIGIPNQDMGYIMREGGMMILMALLSLTCGALSARFGAVSGMGFGANLRKGLFDKIQEFSFGNIDKFSTPSLITRLSTDVNNAQMAFMMALRIMIRAPVMLVSATIMTFTIKPELTNIFLVAIPVIALALFFFISLAFPRFQAMLKKYDGMNASVQENLIAIRVVKAFVRSRHEKEKFKLSNDELMKSSIRAEKIMILDLPLMQLAMYSCIIAILWFGGRLIIVGNMQIGDLMSFISYVSQILMSLMMIAMIIISFVLSKASLTRILEVLEEPIELAEDGVKTEDAPKDGSVEFRNVSFQYTKAAHNQVLEGINLTIRPGETVGIIGGTGSAKTSLVQLIPRLYDVAGGQVLVGGRDVREYRLQVLRDAVSMVLQKNVLFSGTIKENLRWGNKNATDEEIVEACKAAQAHDFITSFPDGYDTDLGQGGVNVSGGQKQRLCIARALLKKPKIIILDDSTSAVDTATDAKIRAAFQEQLKDTTTIIIAQRISSVSSADKIIVLDEGKINGIGTHEELLATNEIYKEVYQSQQKGVA